MKRKTIQVALLLITAVTAAIFLTEGCNRKPGRTKNGTTTQTGFQFLEKLSDYHFFKEPLHLLLPQANLLNYELATPLFTDYAIKDRFILLPAGKTIHYSATGPLDFPDSTIIIKNFSYRDTTHKKILLETRLLVKDFANGKWRVMSYLWNAAQTDALKHIAGAKLPITLLNEDDEKLSTNYQVPNTNDCQRCHTNNDEISPIGLKARNLNFTRDGETSSQLAQWAAQGKIEGLPVIQTIPKFPRWRDTLNFTLEQRARAYLDINCAHCHTVGGDAYNTGLFLDYAQKDPSKLGVMKSPVSAGGGAGGLNYDIVPGDASKSVLVYRMNSAEPGTAMPELARTVIHKEGVKLVADWINSLPKKK